MTADPYVVLGQSAGASTQETHAAYRRLAHIYHPDRYTDARPEVRAEAEERMKGLNSAYSSIRASERERANRSRGACRRTDPGRRLRAFLRLLWLQGDGRSALRHGQPPKYRCNRCQGRLGENALPGLQCRCAGRRGRAMAWQCRKCGHSEESRVVDHADDDVFLRAADETSSRNRHRR